jgi:hypothetical protein
MIGNAFSMKIVLGTPLAPWEFQQQLVVLYEGERTEPVSPSLSTRFVSGDSSGSYEEVSGQIKLRVGFRDHTSGGFRFSRDRVLVVTGSGSAGVPWVDDEVGAGMIGRVRKPTLPTTFRSPTTVIPQLIWTFKLLCRPPATVIFWLITDMSRPAIRAESIIGTVTTLWEPCMLVDAWIVMFVVCAASASSSSSSKKLFAGGVYGGGKISLSVSNCLEAIVVTSIRLFT